MSKPNLILIYTGNQGNAPLLVEPREPERKRPFIPKQRPISEIGLMTENGLNRLCWHKTQRGSGR